MVEGIENKEPASPRMRDGEFIEDECKFLPPPKSMAHPRLFYIKNYGTGLEYFNRKQLKHMFRTYDKLQTNPDIIQSESSIRTSNEDAISYLFLEKKHKAFNA